MGTRDAGPVGLHRDTCGWAGWLTALGVGFLAMTGCSGATDSRSVSSVVVSPSAVGLQVGAQATLRATVTDASGHVMAGSPVFWSTEDGAIASVSPGGVVTAGTPGRVRVAASVGGVAGTATVSVSPVQIASVVVVPQTLTVAPGATAQLRAAAYDGSGQVVDSVTAVWGSSNQAIVTVDTSGVATGIAAGTATITAAISDRFGSATVVVPSSPKPPPPPPPPPGMGGGNGHGHHGNH
jgi:uncharacterized protein YjdB